MGCALPGQASDAPEIVQLYDRNGNLLQETQIEMVQFVAQVEWKDKSVHIKLVANGELPE